MSSLTPSCGRVPVLVRTFTVLAVAALAVSTWYLSSPARRPPPSSDAVPVDLPGYYLKEAVLTDYDEAGAPLLRIEAARIDQLGHTAEVELHDVRVDYLGQAGQNWVMFGDRARVESGGHVIDVNGNVRLQGAGAATPADAIIHTDTLRYDVPHAIAATRSDVRIDFGPHSLTAHGLTANLKERTLRLESKVNGRFQP